LAFLHRLGRDRSALEGLGVDIDGSMAFFTRRLIPGGYLPFFQQLSAMALALLPVGICLGLLFQIVANQFMQKGGTLALAYAIECSGGLIGGALATVALSAHVSNFSTAVICSASALFASVFGLDRGALKTLLGKTFIALFGVSLLSLFAALWLSRPIDKALTAWNRPRLLETIDTPYGRTTITGSKGQISLFQNNALVAESQSTSAEEFVHLSALQHTKPESILILGGGIEGLIREAQQHKPRRIDHIELDERAWNLAVKYLTKRYLQSPLRQAAQTCFTDPRASFRDSRYKADLIILGMPEPDSAQSNRFYTYEFFRQAAAHLSSSGVLAFRLRYAENLWTSHLLRRASSIHRALLKVFPHVTVLPGTSAIFIASRNALVQDPNLLAERFLRRGVKAHMVSPGYIRYLYTNDRFREIKTRLAQTEEPPNSDTRPVCYQHTIVIWLSQFFPRLALMDLSGLDAVNRVPATIGFALFLALSLLFLLVRRRSNGRRLLLAAVAGFLAMVIESAFIVNYQARSGVLYQDLGLLLTLFMAGLAAGAALLDRVSRTEWFKPLPAPWFGAAILIAFIVLDLYSIWIMSSDFDYQLILNGTGLFCSGALVAALFAYASLGGIADQPLVRSSLYAADLLGGCLGSLAASLFLLPILGIINTFLLIIALSLAALWLI
jgi:spermidine synthase